MNKSLCSGDVYVGTGMVAGATAPMPVPGTAAIARCLDDRPHAAALDVWAQRAVCRSIRAVRMLVSGRRKSKVEALKRLLLESFGMVIRDIASAEGVEFAGNIRQLNNRAGRNE